MVDTERIRQLNHYSRKKGPVVYWMSRDQRVQDNWALLFAAQLATSQNQLFLVVFTLDSSFPGANLRHFDFMLHGLMEVEDELRQLNTPFILLQGYPVTQLLNFIETHKSGAIVTDFDPLKIKRAWKHELLADISVPVYEVDAHNVIPCWVASQKEEFGAYTLRPKIKKLLPRFLTGFDNLPVQKNSPFSGIKTNWTEIFQTLQTDNSVRPLDWIKPGAMAANKMLQDFIANKLNRFLTERNDPTKDALSNLSPYLHFGQISAQRIAIEIIRAGRSKETEEAFLEEIIVRRELADNFCFYNPDYDSAAGFKDWAKKTLDEHRPDKREYIYSADQFENARTHDPLWNAAQSEMAQKGKMHGYMRMYWAKKILEWTPSPEEALKIAIYLNDKYELDGRDPNGYVGCVWSIGGVHDRAWTERRVFGKIRYMNYNGCKRKFDVNSYIRYVNQMQRLKEI